MNKYILLLILLLVHKQVKAGEKIDKVLLNKTRQFLIQEECVKGKINLKAYRDGAYFDRKSNRYEINYSIGVGIAWHSNGKKVQKNDRITKKKAMQELDLIIIQKHNLLYENKFYKKANMQQKMIMISLVYNLGYNGFMSTKIGQLIAELNDMEEMYNYINKYNKKLYSPNLSAILITTQLKQDIVKQKRILREAFLSEIGTKKDIVRNRRIREFNKLFV